MLRFFPKFIVFRLLLTVLLFAAIAASATSQVPAQVRAPEPAAREKDMRTVYVALLDKKGVSITDVKSDQLSIFEGKLPQQVVGVSSSSESPLVLGIMIDLSGSTVGDKTRHEKLNVLLRFLAGVASDSEQVFVSAFSMSARRLTGITANSNEIWSGLKQVDETRPVGGTALYDSLVSTIDSLPVNAKGRKVLIVFSDFSDNSSHLPLDKAIRELQFTGTTIFALVDLETGREPLRSTKMSIKVARQIADETGGEALVIESPQEMETALRHFQSVLKGSYALQYLAIAQPKKDGSVPLKIEVRRPDLQLLYTRQRPPATP